MAFQHEIKKFHDLSENTQKKREEKFQGTMVMVCARYKARGVTLIKIKDLYYCQRCSKEVRAILSRRVGEQ